MVNAYDIPPEVTGNEEFHLSENLDFEYYQHLHNAFDTCIDTKDCKALETLVSEYGNGNDDRNNELYYWVCGIIATILVCTYIHKFLSKQIESTHMNSITREYDERMMTLSEDAKKNEENIRIIDNTLIEQRENEDRQELLKGFAKFFSARFEPNPVILVKYEEYAGIRRQDNHTLYVQRKLFIEKVTTTQEGNKFVLKLKVEKKKKNLFGFFFSSFSWLTRLGRNQNSDENEINKDAYNLCTHEFTIYADGNAGVDELLTISQIIPKSVFGSKLKYARDYSYLEIDNQIGNNQNGTEHFQHTITLSCKCPKCTDPRNAKKFEFCIVLKERKKTVIFGTLEYLLGLPVAARKSALNSII
jgi:hypothetical protein